MGVPGGDRAIPRYFRALAAKLMERGHRVVLVTEPRNGAPGGGSGQQILHWPSTRPVHFRDARFFSKLLAACQPDCVISNFAASNVMMMVASAHRVPCRIDWYHTLSDQIQLDLGGALQRLNAGVQRARKRLVYRLATHVVSNTRCAERDLQHVFRVPARKTAVLHYAMGDPGMSEADSRARFRVVCPGRLDISKGQEDAIRAIALLKARIPEIEIEFIGDGPRKAAYQELAGELGVSGRCVFRGAVPLPEVHRAMRRAAITLVPSRSEAFGLVNIESMAVGTPVVASRTGGVSEIVRHGEDGLLVTPGNAGSIADALARLLVNPELREQMGKRARLHFLAEFEAGRALEGQGRWLEQAVASRIKGAAAGCGRLERSVERS
jgi:glycosyltransferase involved in cell wall biosynthesis